jgi:CHAD domain
MGFRFRLNEPLEGAVRRIGIEQIERAEAKLAAGADMGKAVHETRKGLKRIRALLRLIRPGLKDGVYKSENSRFRSIAALLAPSRDGLILGDTLRALERQCAGGPDAAFTAAGKAIAERTQQNREIENEGITKARLKLAAARKKFQALRLSPDDFSMLEAGLETCFRRARRSFAAAYGTRCDHAFHDWRKGVQTHWRQMALLSHAWPGYFESRVETARTLSQLLGEDHDLFQLTTFIRSLGDDRLSALQGEAIEDLARKRQEELRRSAAPYGRMLFAEGARGFSRRTAVIWAAAEELQALETTSEAASAADDKPEAERKLLS